MTTRRGFLQAALSLLALRRAQAQDGGSIFSGAPAPDDPIELLYSRRLQLQERLTEQISQAVMESIDAKGVGVMIEARHLCMMMRGVEKQNSEMVTSSVLGTFRESQATREEFLALIGQRGALG